ncbi:MAG TPA: hypothetical protein VNP94_02740 [Actinomycetota bacterium]|nr:hypothetical protein [Actinomycetota bacterium]
MRLGDLRVTQCVSCGRSEPPLFKLPDALNQSVRACPACLARYGAAALAREADEVLARAEPGRSVTLGRCLHCGERVVARADGAYPAWCTSCHGDLIRLTQG